jgi:class 3 adenylate cyclase
MDKQRIRIVLLIWDVVAIVLIIFSIVMMFETVIKNILIDSNIHNYYEMTNDIQLEYKNSVDFLSAKLVLPYKESMKEIFNYLEMFSLNKLKHDDSLAMILSADQEMKSILGSNKSDSLKYGNDGINYEKFYLAAAKIPGQIDAAEYKTLKDKSGAENLKYVDYFYKYNASGKTYKLAVLPDKNEAERLNHISVNFLNKSFKNYIQFDYGNQSYIGIAQFLSVPVNKGLDKKNAGYFYPVIVVADLQNDFFHLINKVRNIFLIILCSIFAIIFLIKMYNTVIITKELSEITGLIKQENEAIEKEGVIGSILGKLDLSFKETTTLNGSFLNLNRKLTDVGEIISGIADRDLFVATLKNDKSILDPHEVNMAVLFLDVKGFTTISETYKEKAMSIINDIWGTVESVVYDNGGKINKFMGDAVLIIFPENSPGRNHSVSYSAILSAITILGRVPELKRKLGIDFNFRIGVDYGRLVYGKTGSVRNFELGVIGDPVNTAARFESLNKQYNTNLLVSDVALDNGGFKAGDLHKLFGESADEYSFYKIDKARPKGKKEAKEIYTVLLKNQTGFTFIGSEDSFQENLFGMFSKFLDALISNIKYWQDNDVNKGTEIWTKMAKMIGEFYHKSKFPVAEIFLGKLLKYEELLKYNEDPASWLNHDVIEIRKPDEEWIRYGTIELSK